MDVRKDARGRVPSGSGSCAGAATRPPRLKFTAERPPSPLPRQLERMRSWEMRRRARGEGQAWRRSLGGGSGSAAEGWERLKITSEGEEKNRLGCQNLSPLVVPARLARQTIVS